MHRRLHPALGRVVLAWRRHVRTGRPWGAERWLHVLEQRLGRPLRPRTGGWLKGRPRKKTG